MIIHDIIINSVPAQQYRQTAPAAGNAAGADLMWSIQDKAAVYSLHRSHRITQSRKLPATIAEKLICHLPFLLKP